MKSHLNRFQGHIMKQRYKVRCIVECSGDDNDTTRTKLDFTDGITTVALMAAASSIMQYLIESNPEESDAILDAIRLAALSSDTEEEREE